MGQSPCTSRQVDFLNLAVTATDKEHLLVDAPTDDTVRGEWHRCAIELLRDTENAHFTTSRACKQHIAIDKSKVIGSH